MLNIVDACNNKTLSSKVKIIISNNKNSTGLAKVKKKGIKTKIIHENQIKKFEKKLSQILLEEKINLICLAGFMRVLSPKFVSKWKNKILNIHPSILPLFPGLNTHKKILLNGIKIHGSTVHIVNEKLDSGKILGQFAFAVKSNDLDFLIDNIKKYENLLYPEVIKKYIWTFLFKKDKFLKDKKIQLDNVVFSY